MERLEIKNISQELLLEALKTLVLPPQRAIVALAYKGLDQYLGVYEGVSNKGEYFSLCRTLNAIPICVTFEYDHNADRFFPKTANLVFADAAKSKENFKAANECITKDGKIHILLYHMEIPAQKGLQTFLDKEVGKLFNQDYKFREIDVAFSYSDEDCVKADNALYYFRDSLNLRTGCDDKRNSAKLTRWFKKLQKKYER